MLRQYGRLGIVIGTIAFFLVVLSLNILHNGESSTFSGLQRQPEEKPDEDVSGTIYHGPLLPPQDTTTAVESAATPPASTATPETTSTVSKDPPTLVQSSSTTSASPEPPKETTKIIVMGKMSTEDTDWVAQEMRDWQNAIYYVDLPPGIESPTGLKTKMNKAKETTPYLTYIVDHYPDFPDVMAFIHSHRNGLPQAWHTDAHDNDAVNMLNALRLDTVLDRGYVNLRCNNEVGCPDEIQPWREPHDPEKHAEHAFPYIYANFFNTSFAEMKEQISVVATQCCAQFAVSRDQMLSKPKAEYQRYLRFIEETHYDDDTAGRVLEYMWHIIFGRDVVQCEDMFECWCSVYGRCRHGGGTFGVRIG